MHSWQRSLSGQPHKLNVPRSALALKVVSACLRHRVSSHAIYLLCCRAAEATAAEARRKYEAAKLAADEAEKARLAAEGLNQEAQARRGPHHVSGLLCVTV